MAAAAVVCSAAIAVPAGAQSVAGFVPTGAKTNNYVNKAGDQNFLVQFTLLEATSITGAAIYASPGFAPVGKTVTIKFRADAGGSPASANLFSFTDTIDSRSTFDSGTSLARSDFNPIALLAGTYWFGLSGTSSELSWSAFDQGQRMPASQRQLFVDDVRSTPDIYSLGYQIYGQALAVPEPASWAMMIAGMGAVGFALRSAKRRSDAKFDARIKRIAAGLEE